MHANRMIEIVSSLHLDLKSFSLFVAVESTPLKLKIPAAWGSLYQDLHPFNKSSHLLFPLCSSNYKTIMLTIFPSLSSCTLLLISLLYPFFLSFSLPYAGLHNRTVKSMRPRRLMCRQWRCTYKRLSWTSEG